MTEPMTLDEIERRYHHQWVVLTDVEAEPGPRIKRARVYWHGTDHDEAWDRVDELPKPSYAAVFFMGPAVEDGVIPVL